MLDEVQKSIKAILYERTTSPLYGTFAVSWGIWNWKILYYLFWDENKDTFFTKMDCVSELASIHSLLSFPLLATLFFLTIGKLVSNGAYWLNLKFEKWKSDQKNIIERQQLISLEKSIELREQIRLQNEKFSEFIKSKEEEIKILQLEIEQERKLNYDLTHVVDYNEAVIDDNTSLLSDKEYEKIKSLESFNRDFQHLINKINFTKKNAYHDSFYDIINILESNDFIKDGVDNTYQFTEKGKELKKRFVNSTHSLNFENLT